MYISLQMGTWNTTCAVIANRQQTSISTFFFQNQAWFLMQNQNVQCRGRKIKFGANCRREVPGGVYPLLQVRVGPSPWNFGKNYANCVIWYYFSCLRFIFLLQFWDVFFWGGGIKRDVEIISFASSPHIERVVLPSAAGGPRISPSEFLERKECKWCNLIFLADCIFLVVFFCLS